MQSPILKLSAHDVKSFLRIAVFAGGALSRAVWEAAERTQYGRFMPPFKERFGTKYSSTSDPQAGPTTLRLKFFDCLTSDAKNFSKYADQDRPLPKIGVSPLRSGPEKGRDKPREDGEKEPREKNEALSILFLTKSANFDKSHLTSVCEVCDGRRRKQETDWIRTLALPWERKAVLAEIPTRSGSL